MAQVTSGKVLRETRERKGYDLTTVARRLRIRPDILRAIESNDFSSMPPRGYTRNMVNAYARLLGLNPTEIVNMYLNEAYAHQVERARSNPSGSFSADRERRSRTSSQRSSRSGRELVSDDYDDYGDYGGYESGFDDDYGRQPRPATRSGRNGNRRLYDDRTRYSRDDYGYPRERTARDDRSSRDYKSHHSSYPQSNYNIYDDKRNRRSGRRQIHVGQTPMEYSAPRLPAFLSGRLPFLIAIVAVIIVVVVICFFVFGGKGGGTPEDVSSLPVSGINDTTGTDDGAQDENLVVEVAPTSARIVYEVGEGNEVYLETYNDSTTPTAEILQGPEEKTVETTGVWTITTFTPDLIKVTVNGEEVKLQSSDEYNGMYAYTVDFPKMLEEWRSTHTTKQSQRQAAVNSAVNAANAANASSSAATAPAEGSDTAADASGSSPSSN